MKIFKEAVPMASLQLKNIKKTYGNGITAVNDFNLDIEDKEFIIFVGPSGCGKSTTLSYDRQGWRKLQKVSCILAIN